MWKKKAKPSNQKNKKNKIHTKQKCNQNLIFFLTLSKVIMIINSVLVLINARFSFLLHSQQLSMWQGPVKQRYLGIKSYWYTRTCCNSLSRTVTRYSYCILHIPHELGLFIKIGRCRLICRWISQLPVTVDYRILKNLFLSTAHSCCKTMHWFSNDRLVVSENSCSGWKVKVIRIDALCCVSTKT